MKNKTIWVLVLSLALGAAFTAAPARADVTMGVTPSLIELSGKDGSTGEVELTVLNQGNEAFAQARSVLRPANEEDSKRRRGRAERQGETADGEASKDADSQEA